jgi:hypothetical protein
MIATWLVSGVGSRSGRVVLDPLWGSISAWLLDMNQRQGRIGVWDGVRDQLYRGH